MAGILANQRPAPALAAGLGGPQDALGGLLSPQMLMGMGLLQMGQERPVNQAPPTGLLRAAAMMAASQGKERKATEAAAAKAQKEAARQAKLQQILASVSQKTIQPDQALALAGTIPGGTAAVQAVLEQQGLAYQPPKDPSSAIQQYQFAKEQGFTGSFMEYQTQLKQAGRNVNNVNVNTGDKLLTDTGKLLQDRETIARVFGKDSPEMTLFNEAMEKKFAPSTGQANIAQFANQMTNANATMDQIMVENPDFNAANWSDYLQGEVPVIGNALISSAAQRYRQAQKEWVRAKLRKESGAAIPPEEMELEIIAFFPQPGDDAKVRANKKRSRERALAGMKAGEGAAGGRIAPAASTGSAPGLLSGLEGRQIAPRVLRVPPGTPRPSQR